MTQTTGRWSSRLLALALATCAVVAGVALQVALRRGAERGPHSVAEQGPPPVQADQPIASEADVFRTAAAVVAIPPDGPRQRNAHPRTLARYRILRSYPGAPPRIPHGFTADEFRTGSCNTCHRRGGFSPRFGAYVPVTPHPDMPACLQCHVGRDEVTGVTLPSLDPSTICRQCHVPGAARWAEESLDWRPMPWPALQTGTPAAGAVPPIPHELFARTNCMACHSGPSAVTEIRTTHPDRAACRQCHAAPDPEVGEFTRGRSETR